MTSTIDITLLDSIDSKITFDEIVAGHRARTTVTDDKSTVAAFGKAYVIEKPDWLASICQKQTTGSSDFDAIVGFGDGEDLCVKIRNKKNKDKTSASKKIVEFTLGLFATEGSNPPSMLDPNDNFFDTIPASSTFLQVTICPSKLWNNKRTTNEDPSAANTIVLFVEDDELLQVIEDTEKALLEAYEGKYTISKKRKKKDPFAPAGRNSSYTFFVSDVRSSIQDENPEATFADISKIMGERWRTLDPVEKARYEERAAQDKIRYQKEMADYDPKKPPLDIGMEPVVPKKKKTKRDPNAPIAARNRYVLFSTETRSKLQKEYPDLSGAEISAKLNERYQTLSKDEIERYDKLAEEDKARYSRELKEYTKAAKGTIGEVVEEVVEDTEEDVEEDGEEDLVEDVVEDVVKDVVEDVVGVAIPVEVDPPEDLPPPDVEGEEEEVSSLPPKKKTRGRKKKV